MLMRPHPAALMIASIALGLVCTGCSGGATAARLAGRPGSPATSPSTVVARGVPGCTTAVQRAPVLPASATAMTTFGGPAFPFGVGITAGGQWAFASLGSALAVLQISAGHAPRLIRAIPLPEANCLVGVALSPDGRMLLVADGGAGAVVVSVPAAEQGSSPAVLGTLAVPGQQAGGAIEVAVSPDSRYAFVSLETADEVAVFDLAKAVASRFGAGAYVGAIPAQAAPVGLAFSPDGRWLYSTSEAQSTTNESGTLDVISASRAESDPGGSVVASVTAGCNPVRVITSADGSVVGDGARKQCATRVLGCPAAHKSRDALLADVQVGEAPVGLALVRDDSLLVVADSDRFNSAGQRASLAVVDVADALAGRPALLGYLPAGGFPRDMAAGPGGASLLVANYMSHQVEVVNVAALHLAARH